jgi:hypothetical protein
MRTIEYIIRDGNFWKNMKDLMNAEYALAYAAIAAVTNCAIALYVWL